MPLRESTNLRPRVAAPGGIGAAVGGVDVVDRSRSQVFCELPMDVAVETQKLLGVERSVG